MEVDSRKLKAQLSNPDAPDRKAAKMDNWVFEDGDISAQGPLTVCTFCKAGLPPNAKFCFDCGKATQCGQSSHITGAPEAAAAPGSLANDPEMKAMLTQMMQMMGQITTDMGAVKDGLQEAKAKALEAVNAAKQTDARLAEVQGNMLTKPIVREMIDKAITEKIDTHLSNVGRTTGAPAAGEHATIIVGGIESGSAEAAERWLSAILEPKVPLPTRCYFKGDDFNGLLWLHFSTPQQASCAVSTLKASFAKASATKTWCNFDFPIEDRAANSFLFGLKAHLVDWKLPKKYLRVDTDRKILTAGGKEVVRVAVVGDDLNIAWTSTEWAQWAELQQSTALAGIAAKARAKLAKSRQETGKGAGKGS